MVRVYVKEVCYMGRGEKAFYNSSASLFAQAVAMISAFILPRLIMSNFGSSYNGITASVSQFLSVVTLLRSGIGGATRVSLYKALAEKDYKQVSATINATQLFMRKIAKIFLLIIILFACVYPFFVKNEFSWLFSATLVLIISISTFVQYYFGITYYFLLQADQKQYVSILFETLSVILNVILSVILIKIGCGIHIVKLGSAVAFCITPLALFWYCNKKYPLDKEVKPDYSSIGQRWDALFHQIAAFIHNDTDIVLLTIFTTTKEISVYTVYYLVGNGVKKILLTLSAGIESAFGDIIARREEESLKQNLKMYETMIHYLSCVIWGTTIVLITPFVKLYTAGITDVSYNRLIFGYLVVVAEMLFCLRTPYEAIVNAAGHFKQTKKYAMIEAGLNIVVSIVLVSKFGLTGVVIGTIVAITYKSIVFSRYSDMNITKRSWLVTVKRYTITIVNMLCIIFVVNMFVRESINSYFGWACIAVPILCLSFVISTIINFVFYKNEIVATIKKIQSIFMRFL